MQKKLIARFRLAFVILAVGLGMMGCSFMKFPGLYKVPVQQGNIIDQKKVDQLKLGMTKRQAQYVMGTPILMDTFHEDRWDYLYQLHRGDKALFDRKFTLFFKDDKLVKFEGDYEPKGDLDDMEKYIESAKQTQSDM